MKKLFFALTAFAVAVSMGSCEKAAEEMPAAGQPDAEAVMSQVVSYVTEHEGTSALDNISEFYIPVDENAVVVGLVNCDEQAVADFRQAVSNSPLLRFVQCDRAKSEPASAEEAAPETRWGQVAIEPPVTYDFELEPGTTLYKYVSSSWVVCGAVGYRARLNFSNKSGFVTIGHTINENNSVAVLRNGVYVQVGRCTVKKCGGNVDAAFIESTITVSNEMRTALFPHSTKITTVPGPDKSIWIYGGSMIDKNNRPGNAKIVSTSFGYVDADKIAYTGMVRIEIAEMGAADMGGIVVPARGAFDYSPAPYDVMGILCHSSWWGNANCYCPAGPINQALGISIY